MAIALPALDQLPAGPQRDFVVALHDLYDSAGRPSAREISKGIRNNASLKETVSHETVSATLRGITALPSWGKVLSIILQLNAEAVNPRSREQLVTSFHQLWLAARSPGAEGPPEDVKPAASPPTPRTFPRQATQRSSAQEPTPPRQAASITPVIGWLPEQNTHFTGRELLLDRMRESLLRNPNAPMVLYGLGGVGKTQLARQYVQEYEQHYSVIWWVPAGRAELARSALAELAQRLHIPVRASAEQTVASVIGKLESQQFHYLLIFDGADDDSVRQLMPSIGGHIIVTTRDPAWGRDNASVGVEISEFDLSEAIQFLRKRSTQVSGHLAEELTRLVGRLPLALEQIAALQQATKLPWPELLRSFENPDETLLSTGQPRHYPHTLSASLRLALDEMAAANPAARMAFELFVCFGPEPVSIALIRHGRSGDVSPQLKRVLTDAVQFHKAIGDITRFGLARVNAHAQRVEVQPLMRLALHDVLTPEARDRARQNVHAILAAANPGLPDDLTFMDMHKEIAPHIIPAGLLESRAEAAQRAVVHQIRYRYLNGEQEEAARLAEWAVTTWQEESFLGPDHEFVFLATREWANALRALGHYKRSRELTAQARARLQANPAFGDDHEHTLALTASFAADLRIEGRYEQALTVDRDNFTRHVAKYGNLHTRTASSRHNLAVSLRHVGDFSSAFEMDQAELHKHRDQFGLEHSRTLLAANALAEDLYGLGRYQEVLDLQSEYLQTAQRVFGAGHHGLLLAERTVALARRGLGHLNEALAALRKHHSDCNESFGPDHEYTLVAAMSYANALRQRGLAGDAFLLATEVADVYQRTFAPRNPLTLAAEVNLAAIHRARNEVPKALQADQIAREALRDVLGEKHPYTVVATINRATDLALTGDRAGALALSEQACESARGSCGPYHPLTLAACANLSFDRMANGQTSRGEEQLEQVLATMRRTLGPEHPALKDLAGGNRVECDIEPPST